MGMTQRLGAGFIHNLMTGRDAASAHPMSAITGLSDLKNIVDGFNFQPATVTDANIIITGATGQTRYYIEIADPITGAVQFSVDGGLTFYTLYDANGVALTSIPSGYVQIVYIGGNYVYVPEGRGNGIAIPTEKISISKYREIIPTLL